MSNWYKLPIQNVIEKLDTNIERGLDGQEAARRLEQYGPNELIEKGGKSPWLILWDQFTETMVVILIIAAIISAILGDFKDAIAILAIVIINALLGFRQEYKAEQAMAALKKLAVPTVRVRRGGHDILGQHGSVFVVPVGAEQVLLEVKQVAEYLKLTEATIRRKCKEGVFPGAFTVDNYLWRIPERSIKAYIQERIQQKAGPVSVELPRRKTGT